MNFHQGLQTNGFNYQVFLKEGAWKRLFLYAFLSFWQVWG